MYGKIKSGEYEVKALREAWNKNDTEGRNSISHELLEFYELGRRNEDIIKVLGSLSSGLQEVKSGLQGVVSAVQDVDNKVVENAIIIKDEFQEYRKQNEPNWFLFFLTIFSSMVSIISFGIYGIFDITLSREAKRELNEMIYSTSARIVCLLSFVLAVVSSIIFSFNSYLYHQKLLKRYEELKIKQLKGEEKELN